MRYHSDGRGTIGRWCYSETAQIRAKLHDVSTNDAPRDTGNLITYAIACEFLDEIDARYLSTPKVRARSGISARSWSSYFNGHTDGVPLTQWEKVAGALGMRASTFLARAENRLDSLSDTDLELMRGLSGPAAMMVMRDRGRNEAGGRAEPEDPPNASRVRTRSA